MFGYTDSAVIRNIGLVSVSVSGGENVGGLIGKANDNTAVSNAYTTGNVSGNGSVGGLIGVQLKTPAVTNSYWDVETSGQNTSAGGAGLTTAEMKNPDFVWTLSVRAWRWDKDSILNNAYPVLVQQGGIVPIEKPVFTPGSCEFSSGTLKVGITSSVTGDIYVARNPNMTDSFLYTDSLMISATQALYAVWTREGYFSEISSAFYIHTPPPPPPVFSGSARGDFISVHSSDFGNLNGIPVVISSKTAFLAAYLPTFKTNAKPKKLPVKLDPGTLSDTAQKLEMKASISLLNKKLYASKLKTPMTTREILLADSGVYAVQLDSIIVHLSVMENKKTPSDRSVMIMMVPPTIDSVLFLTLDSGLKSEKMYAVVPAKAPGIQPKAWIEHTDGSKVKKLSAPLVKPAAWNTGIADAVRETEWNFPHSEVRVFKLNKKFKSLPQSDLVLDNGNGLNAVPLK